MRIHTKSGLMVAVAIATIGLLVAGAVALSNQSDPSAAEFIAERQDVAPLGQRPALADGVVTFGEYQDAVGATVSCLAQAGYVVTPTLSDQLFRWEYTTADRGRRQAYLGTYNECYVTNLRDIDVAWVSTLESRVPTPSAVKTQDALAVLAQCMRDEGFTVSQGAGIEELYFLAPPEEHTGDDMPVFLKCVLRAEAETGTKISWT